jgi:protein-disulfide isomerase
MRRIPMALALALLLATAPAGHADAPGKFTPEQRAEIVTILREALAADPSILRDAINALQREEAGKEEAASRAAIAQMREALVHTAGDPVAGNAKGDATIVEFYDVRCPFCRAMLPIEAELLRHDHNIRVVFKDIPILGPGSRIAARAVLAAQRQNGYEKLHDTLMTGTPNIDTEVVHAAALKAGLDWPRLQRDMDDPAIQARIDANLKMAHALHIDGTPTYIIGDHMLSGAVELADLQNAVAAARKK